MAEFATWLWQRTDVDAALKALQEFLFAERARWVEPPDSAELYSGAILAHAPAANQQALLQAFARWWGEWQATRSKGSGFWAVIERRPWLVTLVIIVAVFSVFIYRGFNGTFLAALADTAQARGLITYFFALATIGVAITCAVATFIVPANQIDERVAKAKDVLTVLIGVLGTIIGFYFGSQGLGGAPLRIAEATPSLATAAPGGKVTIAATVRGGKPPYRYAIEFLPPAGTDPAVVRTLNVPMTQSPDGAISHEVTLPATGLAGDLRFQILVADADGQAAVIAGDRPIAVKAP